MKGPGIAGLLRLVVPLLLAAPAGAQAPELMDGQELAPPNVDGAPVEVAIGIFLMQINEVDEATERVNAEGYVVLEWKDARLAFDAGAFGSSHKTYNDDEVLSRLGREIWWPNIEFVNAEGGGTLDRHYLRVHPDGAVAYAARFNATTLSPLDLRRFPYDTQIFRITVSPYSEGVERVQFVRDSASTGYRQGLSLAEWGVGGVSTLVDVDDLSSMGELWGAYSRYRFEVEVDRRAGFYVWKIFLPLLLIIASSWTVFWVKDLASQLAVAFTIMLTIVAFNFVVADSLPRVSYLTFMDAILSVSYVSVFLSLLVIVGMHMLEVAGREESATAVMRASRWAFPLGLLATVSLVGVVFLR